MLSWKRGRQKDKTLYDTNGFKNQGNIDFEQAKEIW